MLLPAGVIMEPFYCWCPAVADQAEVRRAVGPNLISSRHKYTELLFGIQTGGLGSKPGREEEYSQSPEEKRQTLTDFLR